MSIARSTLVAAAAMVVLAAGFLSSTAADAKKSEFAKDTIDLGVVVSDVARSVKFYTEAIGFQEGPGFSVAGDFCADAGLTDKKPLKIRVLTLGDGDAATKLKLMDLPGVSSKKSDNAFVHSQLGYRYITIYVADADAAIARLAKAGVKPLAKGPVSVPADIAPNLVLAVVRDPDGNLIELIGPKH